MKEVKVARPLVCGRGRGRGRGRGSTSPRPGGQHERVVGQQLRETPQKES